MGWGGGDGSVCRVEGGKLGGGGRVDRGVGGDDIGEFGCFG